MNLIGCSGYLIDSRPWQVVDLDPQHLEATQTAKRRFKISLLTLCGFIGGHLIHDNFNFSRILWKSSWNTSKFIHRQFHEKWMEWNGNGNEKRKQKMFLITTTTKERKKENSWNRICRHHRNEIATSNLIELNSETEINSSEIYLLEKISKCQFLVVWIKHKRRRRKNRNRNCWERKEKTRQIAEET